MIAPHQRIHLLTRVIPTSREPGFRQASRVRPGAMAGKRREKQTLIPAFDPETLAKELEAAVDRPTITPPYDPSSYARIVDNHVEGTGDGRDTPRTITAATPALAAGLGEGSTANDET